MKHLPTFREGEITHFNCFCYSIGLYFITDLGRKQSIFEVNTSLMGKVNEGINADGSNLGHVTAVCKWLDINAR